VEIKAMQSRIAVIPARSGSRRVPGKNIRLMEGIPLIARTIKLALSVEVFDEIYVTTDDEEIAKISKDYGASVPFLRDRKLADDFTPTQPVISDFLHRIRDEISLTPEFCCCIYSSAFMVPEDVFTKSFEILEASSKLNYVATVLEYPHPIQRALTLDSQTKKVSFVEQKYSKTRTQDLESFYHDAGQMYWGRSKAWMENVALFGDSTAGYALKFNSVVDLDSEEDWKKAEELLMLRKQKNES
jgi:pseudaminic acid cytidylyltransferase